MGNSSPYEQFKTPIANSLILFYTIATFLLVVVMLNLLIAIVGDTNHRVSQMNELIYEKNRVEIIKEYLSSEENKKKMTEKLKGKYLIKIYKRNFKIDGEKSIHSEMEEIRERIGNMEKKMEVNKQFFHFTY